MSTLGAGRLKHVESKFFAVQQMVRSGRITVERVPGKENPADVGTKSLDRRTFQRLLPLTGLLDRRGSTTEATRGRTDMGNAKYVIAGVVTRLQAIQGASVDIDAETIVELCHGRRLIRLPW